MSDATPDSQLTPGTPHTPKEPTKLLPFAALVAFAILAPIILNRRGGPPPPEQAAVAIEAGYPAYDNRVAGARDIRGQVAPAISVMTWINDEAPLAGRVVVVDFWATWCGPCVQSLPHMKELARAFEDDAVTVLGLSSEGEAKFRKGMESRGLDPDEFPYALGLDPTRRTAGALEIRSIPQCMVISSDGVVRWQGHPGKLSENTLRQIVEADQSSKSTASDVS